MHFFYLQKKRMLSCYSRYRFFTYVATPWTLFLLHIEGLPGRRAQWSEGSSSLPRWLPPQRNCMNSPALLRGIPFCISRSREAVAIEVGSKLATCVDSKKGHGTERGATRAERKSASLSLRGGVEHLLLLPSLPYTSGEFCLL